MTRHEGYRKVSEKTMFYYNHHILYSFLHLVIYIIVLLY